MRALKQALGVSQCGEGAAPSPQSTNFFLSGAPHFLRTPRPVRGNVQKSLEEDSTNECIIPSLRRQPLGGLPGPAAEYPASLSKGTYPVLPTPLL